MAHEVRIITVFGSSRPRPGEPDYEQARLLGSALAAIGFRVCTGGCSVMDAASRGAKESEAARWPLPAKFFSFQEPMRGWTKSTPSIPGERLFELIRLGHGYVACKGRTELISGRAGGGVGDVEDKGVLSGKPSRSATSAADSRTRVREVEMAHGSERGEAAARLVHVVSTPAEAADFFARTLINQPATDQKTINQER